MELFKHYVLLNLFSLQQSPWMNIFCNQINLDFDCKPNKICFLPFLSSSFPHFSSYSIAYILRFYSFIFLKELVIYFYLTIVMLAAWYSETLFVPGDSFSQHILVYTHTVARFWDVLGTVRFLFYAVLYLTAENQSVICVIYLGNVKKISVCEMHRKVYYPLCT